MQAETGNLVRQVRLDQGLSQSKFGDALGVTASGIAKIETGDRPLTDQMKKAIIAAFHVNPAYLDGTEDEMYAEEDELARLLGKIFAGQNESAAYVLRRFAKLNSKQWDNLKDILDTLKE